MTPPSSEAPRELLVALEEFFPTAEVDNALAISYLESVWDAFALANTTDNRHNCGDLLRFEHGVPIYAEISVGYFQINACNFPDWEWQRLYNARHNAGTAHMLWNNAGQRWSPWYFSARQLGLI